MLVRIGALVILDTTDILDFTLCLIIHSFFEYHDFILGAARRLKRGLFSINFRANLKKMLFHNFYKLLDFKAADV